MKFPSANGYLFTRDFNLVDGSSRIERGRVFLVQRLLKLYKQMLQKMLAFGGKESLSPGELLPKLQLSRERRVTVGIRIAKILQQPATLSNHLEQPPA